MSWWITKAAPPSPDIILESSIEGDDENEIALPIQIPVCDAEHIDASVEEIRNSPSTRKPIFESSDEDDAITPNRPYIPFIQWETFRQSRLSPLDLRTNTKKFQFKPRNIHPNTDNKEQPSLPEESLNAGNELDNDFTKAFQLLEIDAGKPREGLTAATNAEVEGESVGSSSDGTLDLADPVDSVKDDSDGVQVLQPRRIERTYTRIYPDLKTFFLDESPGRSAPSSTSSVIPPTAHHQADRTLTLLSKTIQLSPQIGEQAPAPAGFKLDLDPYQALKSFQLLEIDAGKPREGLTAATNAEVKESVGSSSDGTPDLADSVDSVKDDSDSVQVMQPRRIEPTYPNKQPWKFPGRSAPSSTSSVIPSSADHQVDRALTLLSKTIELIPQIGEEAPTPDGFKVSLYPYQAYGLQWLWWREHHFPGGGILADEMGLGKTVMILALIMKSLAEGSPSFNKKENAWHTNDKKLIESTCTLIVVPASVIGQWELEIKEKTTGLRYYVYHGPKREKSAKLLSRYHIVLTTFPTMASDLPKEDERRYVDTPLAKIRFDRIILDEGHVIRNSKANTADAVCQINANHRWVVTGTPIHNKLADMHSLVKFLRLTPFDDRNFWDRLIGLKKAAGDNTQPRLNIIGRALILRRTKQEVMVGPCPIIPPKQFEDVELELNKGEQDIYDHLEAYAKSTFEKFEQKEVSFATILTLLLRLRQCCVLPHLIHLMVADDVDSDADPNSKYLPKDDEIISLLNPVFAHNHRSIKILRLIEDLNLIRKKAREENKPMDKVVIVSQWSSFLNIVKGHLVNAGFSTCAINGKVKIPKRAEITMKFNSGQSEPEVMLLSLTTGGVGLNLIGANHMFFMDLHWNPQLELQCQDRIHRIGQTKPVTIHRYITKDTIEQRVLRMQKGKLELASGLLENKTMEGALTIQEMKKLFDV